MSVCIVYYLILKYTCLVGSKKKKIKSKAKDAHTLGLWVTCCYSNNPPLRHIPFPTRQRPLRQLGVYVGMAVASLVCVGHC